ncbi:hypothetical protein [Christiangramia sp.]|nr:hypothetical protein [Christiangramia sp.]
MQNIFDLMHEANCIKEELRTITEKEFPEAIAGKQRFEGKCSCSFLV